MVAGQVHEGQDVPLAETAPIAAPDINALIGRLRASRLTVAVAETCTGGLISAALTAPAGASDYFVGGAIPYANRLKIALLNIDPELLTEQGAVSQAAAMALARAIRQQAVSDLGLGITGLAGPATGHRSAKPTGLVYIALVTPTTEVYRIYRWPSPATRAENQHRTASAALALLYEVIQSEATQQ